LALGYRVGGRFLLDAFIRFEFWPSAAPAAAKAPKRVGNTVP
jgi:hypothetical protein